MKENKQSKKRNKQRWLNPEFSKGKLSNRNLNEKKHPTQTIIKKRDQTVFRRKEAMEREREMLCVYACESADQDCVS